MSSRRYLKRVWRVPKHRGATEALATLIVKALRKHGWPADWRPEIEGGSDFHIIHKDLGLLGPEDFKEACDIACRVVARAYCVEIDAYRGVVSFVKPYSVNERGEFRPIK